MVAVTRRQVVERTVERGETDLGAVRADRRHVCEFDEDRPKQEQDEQPNRADQADEREFFRLFHVVHDRPPLCF